MSSGISGRQDSSRGCWSVGIINSYESHRATSFDEGNQSRASNAVSNEESKNPLVTRLPHSSLKYTVGCTKFLIDASPNRREQLGDPSRSAPQGRSFFRLTVKLNNSVIRSHRWTSFGVE